jgi:membrane-bound lytic murein transglycosylase B
MNRSRKWMRREGLALVAAAVVLLSPALCRASAPEGQAAGQNGANEVVEDPSFAAWLAALRQEARGKGISEATLNAALRDIVPLDKVIELDRRQPEFTQTFWAYLDLRVSDERAKRGRRLMARHRALLNRIQAQYGVPSRYLVAFWGLETNFGAHMGGFPVIQTLATLAFDHRRSQFFRTQLLDALRIIDQGHILPDAMTGSWAGAMGHMQFMPATFNRHAVDDNGDGRKDIWGSLPDAFASAANYLSNMGWRPGQTWGREVRLPENFDLTLATMEKTKGVEEWSALGVRRADGGALPRRDMDGAIVLPQGRKGPAFLVYDNFRVMLRWNRSINYALSVGHLADRIVGMPPLSTGRAAAHAPLAYQEIKEIQQLLNRLGFDAGAADGLPGPRTRAAIRAFQRAHGLPPDGYPAPDLLRDLRLQAPPPPS